MKKALTVILSIFYFSLSIGAMVNLHYCYGELKRININVIDKSCCCGSNEIPNGCCENKVYVLELNIDQQNPVFINFIPDIYPTIIPELLALNLDHDNEVNNIKLNNYSLPPPKPEHIWILNCSLTFYG